MVPTNNHKTVVPVTLNKFNNQHTAPMIVRTDKTLAKIAHTSTENVSIDTTKIINVFIIVPFLQVS